MKEVLEIVIEARAFGPEDLEDKERDQIRKRIERFIEEDDIL